MMNFTLITALLCLISVCVCELHTVEVQPGEDVTLTCSNFTSTTSYIFWFRLADRSNISCISSMTTADGNASFCDGFRNGKFNMTSNITTLFLTIQQVDLSDSGLYFCGFYKDEKPVIDSATYLKVQGMGIQCDVISKLSGILGAVTVVLVSVIIGLAVRVRKLQTAANEEQSQPDYENDCDVLKDAELTEMRNRRTASEREVETHVVYTARR
ncbi:uncharacterized protein LOC131989871 [Centropristis striata]|uniref:uncharacterized protein LOC131989871 n=1 Tax=Centropristis striata TaxID=184440 RepID=UPI0027DEE544|nr:uncharacterized protein LOC131989871 [Centropristis striata]